ncbi:MAG TPA: hypothetical protein DCM08_14110 [Microscillaceae bacterium]|jgi:hypothetical protein|nr:hypothetical protein [Microscillaceae bacterium]
MYKIRFFILSLLVVGLSSCMTYYQRNVDFYRNFETGRFDVAEKVLEKNKKMAKGKDRLLYFLNFGTVNALQGEYEMSNEYFEDAYLYGEDYVKEPFASIGQYLLNPTVVPYKGEDFEHLLVNYYKAVNFLKMGDMESALVECRRMDVRLRALSDKYTSDNKFKRDAFIYNLMGIIYEANQDYNNAFVAYRNAVEIYEEDYHKFFEMETPRQLKMDLLRMCYKMGFESELLFFQDKFQMTYEPEANEGKGGELIFLWHNGLGPLKTEVFINFGVNHNGGHCYFRNDEMDLFFDFDDGEQNLTSDQIKALDGLSSISVAFPKYIERPEFFSAATLICGNDAKDLQLAEDINKIAFKSLRQRMLLEFGKTLIRVALKETIEKVAEKKDATLGLLVGIFNTVTEQADTRAWHSIPHGIYYTRMYLPEGQQTVQFVPRAAGGSQTYDFTFNVQKNKTIFHTFHSLQVDPSFDNPYY